MVLANSHGRGSCFSFYSEDTGRTWSNPTEIRVEGIHVKSENVPSGDLGLKVAGSRTLVTSLCRLSDGTIGALLIDTSPGDHHTGFFVSNDEGKTFTGGTRLGPGGTGYSAVYTSAFNGLLQLRSLGGSSPPSTRGSGTTSTKNTRARSRVTASGARTVHTREEQPWWKVTITPPSSTGHRSCIRTTSGAPGSKARTTSGPSWTTQRPMRATILHLGSR